MIVEPKHEYQSGQRQIKTDSGRISAIDLIRMRVTMAATLGLVIYIFFRVIF
jgi:hypothetical protein